MSYKDNPKGYTRCEKCKHIDRKNEKCKVTNDNWLVSDRAGTCHQFEGVENMKARCLNNKGFENLLSIGEVYEVCDYSKLGGHAVINLKGKPLAFNLDRFDIVKEETEKEFEEQMERVGDLASKCSISGEELFNNPIKPNHYQAGEFDVIAFCFKHNLDFATGNIIKYVTRAGKKDKDKTLEDLEKGKEYLERKIEWVKANV